MLQDGEQMKDQYHITTCDQCGKNARVYLYGDFSVAWCKKHTPPEHIEKIEKMGFKWKTI